MIHHTAPDQVIAAIDRAAAGSSLTKNSRATSPGAGDAGLGLETAEPLQQGDDL